MTVNDRFMYGLFADIYYDRALRQYTDTQVSVTETTQCLLKSFYQRKLRRKLFDMKIVILSFGDLVHVALREPLLRLGYDTEKEGVYSFSNVELFAHADAVGLNHGIEVKTVTRMPHSPLTHHFLQANAYIKVFEKEKWYLSYLHKPSGRIVVHSIEYSDKAFQYNCLRAVRLSHHLKFNTLPMPEPSWLCKYCEYTDICPAKMRV